jgi:radical SAM protein
MTTLAPRTDRSPVGDTPSPRLVLWETTQACPLSCVHCRAEAITEPAPDELTLEEGFALLEDIASGLGPRPIVVFTGGDPLSRPDLFALLNHAHELGLHTAVSPAVSPRLDASMLERLVEHGVQSLSVSLDGIGEAHDRTRRVPGHWAATLGVLRAARAAGLHVQVNTTVMRHTVGDLPAIASAMVARQVHTWEVFFLVPTGRAGQALALEPAENEDVARFLYDVTAYGFVVRTVEGPFYRRVAEALARGDERSVLPPGELYARLARELVDRLGPPSGPRRLPSPHPIRDGAGVVFVSRRGDVYASGFLPIALGNVRERSLREIYAADPLLAAIRTGALPGRCGRCAWRDTCGGSRARAWALTGDPLADDPGCALAAAGA